jgi:transposase
VAVEVFEGNTGDPKTLASQIAKLKGRFHLSRVIVVGDRGLLTEARLEEDLRPSGLDWISALRSPAIRHLVEQGAIQLTLFDERDLAEIRSEDYPGERLIVCRNPLLAEERRRKRLDLLQATERELSKIAQATGRKKNPLRGKGEIALRIGKVINRYKMGKHFQLDIGEEGFTCQRREAQIAQEAALDGFYVIRTNVPKEVLTAEETVLSYKRLSSAERAFRSLKTVDLKVRPIHHRLADRVRSHVFLCMLAFYVEWHMRKLLAAILFDDDDRVSAQAQRTSVVAPAQRSPRALEKAWRGETEEGWPVHSFQGLLRNLATLCKNRVQPKIVGAGAFTKLTSPTPFQQHAFNLLGVSPSL